MHEHIFLVDFEYVENYRPDWNEDQAVADAVETLDGLKALGIDTIVDLTVLGLGRHIKRVARVAEQTGLNIIAATGAYTFDKAPHGFEYWGPGLLADSATEPMVDCFVRDITEGIAGTGIKAGELKCAIDEPGLKAGRRTGDAGGRQGPPDHRRADLGAHRAAAGDRASSSSR